jgi:hypothetical protein
MVTHLRDYLGEQHAFTNIIKELTTSPIYDPLIYTDDDEFMIHFDPCFI